MATLNIVNKSPFEKRSLEQCLDRVATGSSVLLIEDAVTAAVAGTAQAGRLNVASETLNLYVLKPDLDARGFAESPLLAAFKVVDYAGFVDLVTQHERVNSWL